MKKFYLRFCNVYIKRKNEEYHDLIEWYDFERIFRVFYDKFLEVQNIKLWVLHILS